MKHRDQQQQQQPQQQQPLQQLMVAPHTPRPQLRQPLQLQYMQAQEMPRRMQAQQHQQQQQPPMSGPLAAPSPVFLFRAEAGNCRDKNEKGVLAPPVPVAAEVRDAESNAVAQAGPEPRPLQPVDEGTVPVRRRSAADRCASEAAKKGERRGSARRGRSEAAAKAKGRTADGFPAWSAEALQGALGIMQGGVWLFCS
jgi:hypothetical protein